MSPSTRWCGWCGQPFESTRATFCSPACRGRALRRELTAAELEAVELLAAEGRSEPSIARALAISPPTWRTLRERDPRLADALARGRATEEEALVGALKTRALDPRDRNGGDAAKFLLRARHGYGEPAEDGEGRAAVRVEITLPAALPPERYARAIEAEVTRRTSGPLLPSSPEKERPS